MLALFVSFDHHPAYLKFTTQPIATTGNPDGMYFAHPSVCLIFSGQHKSGATTAMLYGGTGIPLLNMNRSRAYRRAPASSFSKMKSASFP